MIAWAILRILQQTSAVTLIIKPEDQSASEQQQSQQQRNNSIASQHQLHEEIFTGPNGEEYIIDHTRQQHNSPSRFIQAGSPGQYGNVVGSSASSIYSSATSSSGYSSNTNTSSLYYSPPTPQYNPYGGSGATRGSSPTRVSPARKPASSPVSAKGGTPSSPVRRSEPRIVAIDEPEESYRPYPARHQPHGSVSEIYRKSPGVDTTTAVLEKPAGQSAFRMQRKVQ